MKKEENFEELMNKLETITSRLEKDEDLSLDESIKLFEEGINISKVLNEQIEKAEKKISILINTNDGIKEENFIQNEEQ